MQQLSDSVGPGQPNVRHDVALVQAALRFINAPNGRPYLRGSIDGGWGTTTHGAVTAFQADHGGDAVPIAPEVITPGGATVTAMAGLLPANRSDLRVLPGQRVVFLGRPAADAAATEQTIRNHASLVQAFRGRVADLVLAMHRDHGIVLALTATGARRTFAEQSRMRPPATNAQAGESNHNYGRAVDIGFDGLVWFQRNATAVTGDSWLNRMANYDAAGSTAFWDARDALALVAPISLFRLQFERIHLQSYDDATASARRSLAAHLTAQGAWNWRFVRGRSYESDLGGTAGTFVNVGEANTVWGGNASVTAAEIQRASWVRPPTMGGPPAGGAAPLPITRADIAAVRAQLQADMQAADRNWTHWGPVP